MKDHQRQHVDDPRGEIMVQARVMTFGKRWWPHEDKRGWLPKIESVSINSRCWLKSGVLTRVIVDGGGRVALRPSS